MGPHGYERGDLDRKAATIRMEIPGLLDPRVYRTEDSGFGWTVIRPDPVSVRVNDECGVVIGSIYRAQTWCTVVLPTGAQRRSVKCIDCGGILRCKAEV